MLCLATMINYVDGQALAVVSVEVRQEFGVDERDYSHIVMLFFITYAIIYAGSGYLSIGWERGMASAFSSPDVASRKFCTL